MFEQMKAISMSAFQYLALSWSVIPLAYREKHPAWSVLPKVYDPAQKRDVPKWESFQKRHATRDDLDYWFNRSRCNVGIVTGAISGIVVLDCDSLAAYLWVKKYVLEYHDKTPIASTGKGWHVFFKHPGTHVQNAIKSTGVDGLDIKADGGYVVAPPSIHPSGQVYNWILPPDRPLADLPTWFFEPIHTCAPAPISVAAAVNRPDPTLVAAGVYPAGKSWAQARFDTLANNLRRAKVPAGNSDRGSRNDQLFKAAHGAGQIMGLKPMYKLRVGELDRATVERELSAIALGLGLTDREIKATLQSGFNKGEAHAHFLEKYLDDHKQADWWSNRRAGLWS